MFSLATASGPVRIVPAEPDPSGAVRYALTGAVKGTVHVVASHNPRQWDDFRALRISLGSENGMRVMPAEPLPRIRGRAYTGVMTRILSEPADQPDSWRVSPSGLRDLFDRDAPPQAAATLHAVMRACGEHYAARDDLPDLQSLARWLEAPMLCGWLEPMISTARAHVARYQRDELQHRQDARQCVRAWWLLARLGAAQPSPLLAYLLGGHRDSLAHRASYLPRWAEISATGAADVQRRLTHFMSEYEQLRHRGRTPLRVVRAAQCAS
ncbi:hypothetical protein N4G70_31940 [Streptomyces sp. ASQP_92]|uniref:hypothetical protein n=1 Tax=Streptomyces sp. ASQP_92 TaxID=2979116 RepID=UPI0021C00B2F|nr:hypothetical protein [Streptomyces sp. ASQP_92]MCT9093446.1 hypothetical protein [Streptomyces sp. ASQP_92]